MEVFQNISECRFRDAFHMYCPGCGGTRAVKALLAGDVLKSFLYNPVPICLLLDCILIILTIGLEHLTGQKNRYLRLRFLMNLGLLIIIVMLFVIRNYLLLYCGIDVLGDFKC